MLLALLLSNLELITESTMTFHWFILYCSVILWSLIYQGFALCCFVSSTVRATVFMDF